MKRTAITIILALAAAPPILAQSTYARTLPPPRPVVSPYLNLFRSGNSAAFNYSTLVRPELELQKSLGQLNNQIQQIGTAQAAGSAELPLETGHRVGFQTHKRYFMSLGNSPYTAGNPAVRANRSPATAAPATAAPTRR